MLFNKNKNKTEITSIYPNSNCEVCKYCKSIRGQRYCSLSVADLSSGKRDSLLYVDKNTKCEYF